MTAELTRGGLATNEEQDQPATVTYELTPDKPRLTQKDEVRLRELESELGPLPTGETKTERETLDPIQRAAERLRSGRK